MRPSQLEGALVEIELPDGTIQQRPLVESHITLGRSPSLQLVLDHHSVSRRHAEIVRDPFGRHWVRDLASTNGTTVNGERIEERVLAPGDRVGIGDARLTFRVAQPTRNPGATIAPRGPEPALTEVDDGPSSLAPSFVRTFREAERPKVGADHLAHLLAFGRRLSEVESPSARLSLLCDLLVGAPFHGQASVALRLTRDAGRPRTGGGVRPVKSYSTVLAGPSRAPTEHDPEAPYLSRRLLGHVATTGEAALASSAATGPAALDLSVMGTSLAAIACPIGPRRDDGTIDAIYASFPLHVAGAEWVSLIELAAEAYRQSGMAWLARQAAHSHAAIERELETARRIQRAIVPSGLGLPGLEVELGFEACRWVGGDYVDAVALADGRVLLAVADVCGKGLQAALVTFSLHTMVRALGSSCGRGMELVELVTRIDAHLGAYLPEDSFATMCCVVLDPATGELESVNAGHLPPLVFDAEGRSRQLPSELDPPLGLVPPGVPFIPTASRSRLEPGETLFLYTDGLTELRNGAREMLGEGQLTAGLAAVIARVDGEPLASVASGLASLLDVYRGDQLPEDDRGYVLARRT